MTPSRPAMSGSADAESLPDQLSRGLEPPTAGDAVLLALAAVDVLLLFVVDVYAVFLPDAVGGTIVLVDLGLVAVFALAFLAEMARASDRTAYARSHWYDLVGLVPIAHWAFRSFRLVDLLRRYVVEHHPVERSAVTDWTDALARVLFARYRDVQVEELADPIVLSAIERLRGPLVQTRWAQAIGGSLALQRPRLRAAVGDALAEDARVGRVARTRPGRFLVDEVTDATLDATIETLQSEEVNDVVGEAIDGTIDEVRARVEASSVDAQ